MKKRGAPKKNKNAQRHGFYAKLYTKEEVVRLQKGASIEDEQDAARVVIYKILSELQSCASFGEDQLKQVSTLINAMAFVNTIERTKILERGHGGEIAVSIMEAIMALDPYKDL